MFEFSVIPEENKKPLSINQKISVLKQDDSDFEFYPTTDEILKAMNADLQERIRSFAERSTRHNPIESMFSYDIRNWNQDTNEYNKLFCIDSFLDVGAGDGRVFEAVKPTNQNDEVSIEKKYGIEKAKAQSDDLIRHDVFIIGRDFFETSLMDKSYSVIFSNPPYSVFVPWCEKLLKEANFGLMYFVLPVRWKNQKEIMRELERYEYEILGEYDFNGADRSARARVNLIRISQKTIDIDNERYEKKQDDSFTRWIDENLGKIEEGEKRKSYDDEQNALKAKADDISEAVEQYEYEKNNLLLGLKAIPILPSEVLKALGIDRKSFIETVKKSVAAIKNKYWRFVFDKLQPINSRLTKDTRNKLLGEMAEFKTVDFNADNIYSIIIWVINNFNKYTNEQIVSMFEKLTKPDYIKAYKSNRHWDKDTWRYAAKDCKNEFEGNNGKGKPEKYKLDYRIVARCYCRFDWDTDPFIDDLIVVFRSLGYDIPEYVHLDFKDKGTEQFFHSRNNELVFTARLYMNGNVHLKINQMLMMKFNIEAARILGWVRGPADIQDEFDVTEEEAVILWKKPSLITLGMSDMKMLECKEAS